jgi:two-component system sensor histidine kinase UhpB
MSDHLGLPKHLRRRLSGFSICARIAIGNAVIIVVGATLGSLMTRYLAARAPDLVLTVFLIAAGCGLSIAASYGVTRLALQPLIRLRRLSEEADGLSSETSLEFLIPNPDPDTCLVASTLGGLIADLETNNRQLKSMRERSIGAQEEERKRIARGLHDDTGQALTSLILQLDRLYQRTPAEQPEMKAQIMQARDASKRTLKELRKLIQDLRPAILDDLGLVPAIRWYARSTLEPTGISVELQVPEGPLELPPDQTITLFRVAQEAVNNIARHSQACTARLSIRRVGDEIYLRIEDDGRGFHPAEGPDDAMRQRHWGLIGIQERLDLIGGTLNLKSDPGRGTWIEVRVPLNGRKEALDEQKDPHPARG